MFNINDGATFCVGSDRYAGTIIQKSASGKTVFFQDDHARRIDKNGYGGNQEWKYKPNTNGAVRKFTLRKDGSYREVGTNYVFLAKGRNAYQDPSF